MNSRDAKIKRKRAEKWNLLMTQFHRGRREKWSLQKLKNLRTRARDQEEGIGSYILSTVMRTVMLSVF